MLAAALAAALLALALTAGRRGHSRDAVAAYIVEVNAVEQRHAGEVGLANVAYRNLDLRPKKLEAQAAALTRAERALQRLRDELAAVEAPRDARVLRAKLLHVIDGQIEFAREVTKLRSFLPALSRQELDVATTTRRLRRTLGENPASRPTANAFAVYADGLRAVAARIARLQPPVALAPSRDSRVSRLRELSRLSARVATELRAGHAAEASHLARTLARIAATPSPTASAQAAAIRSYNALLRDIVRRQAALVRERNRLNART